GIMDRTRGPGLPGRAPTSPEVVAWPQQSRLSKRPLSSAWRSSLPGASWSFSPTAWGIRRQERIPLRPAGASASGPPTRRPGWGSGSWQRRSGSPGPGSTRGPARPARRRDGSPIGLTIPGNSFSWLERSETGFSGARFGLSRFGVLSIILLRADVGSPPDGGRSLGQKQSPPRPAAGEFEKEGARVRVPLFPQRAILFVLDPRRDSRRGCQQGKRALRSRGAPRGAGGGGRSGRLALPGSSGRPERKRLPEPGPFDARDVRANREALLRVCGGAS